MLKKIFDTSDKNQMKKNAVYLLLLITNIYVLIGLLLYFPNVGINFNMKSFENFSAVIATIIILCYISMKLPKIKDIGESSVYGMLYMVIICIIGLMSSYFNGMIKTATVFGPYLEMFKILCGVLIFIILATTMKSFKNMILGNHERKNEMVCLIVFTAIGIFASYAHVTTNGTPANIRCLVVMIGGLFGGPIVGIPVGLISGAYRFTLGGPTAVPCAISTVVSGIIGSLIFIWNDKKFPRITESIFLMFLFTGFEMFLIIVLTPSSISFPFVANIYPIMLFASVVGMVLFLVALKEAEEKVASEDYDELDEEIEKDDEEILELKKEIAELKSEVEALKKE